VSAHFVRTYWWAQSVVGQVYRNVEVAVEE
jgi:hypothetical protein